MSLLQEFADHTAGANLTVLAIVIVSVAVAWIFAEKF